MFQGTREPRLCGWYICMGSPAPQLASDTPSRLYQQLPEFYMMFQQIRGTAILHEARRIVPPDSEAPPP